MTFLHFGQYIWDPPIPKQMPAPLANSHLNIYVPILFHRVAKQEVQEVQWYVILMSVTF